jgi:hypothetical protein
MLTPSRMSRSDAAHRTWRSDVSTCAMMAATTPRVASAPAEAGEASAVGEAGTPPQELRITRTILLMWIILST